MIGPLVRHREKAKSALLALLVGLSFFLSLMLWLETPGGGPPPRPQPYVAAGNLGAGGVPLADVLLPRRVIVHRSGRHFVVADAARPAFRAAVAAAGEALSAASRQGAPPVPVAAAEPAAIRRTGAAVELVLPAELPAGEWIAAWLGEAAAEGLPRSGLSRVPARRLAISFDAAGRLVLYLQGAQGWVRVGAGNGGPLREKLRESIDLGSDGEAAAALAGRWRNIRVADDLYVPVAPRFARAVAMGEGLDADRLAGSFFPDPGVVRRVEGRDGSLLYTDGQQGLRIGADGSVRFDGPQAAARKAGDAGGESILVAARDAVTFVADHGGWPRGARLLAVHPEQGLARLDIAPDLGGYPLLGFRPAAPGDEVPAAVLAPVSLTVATPGGVGAYRRAILLPSTGAGVSDGPGGDAGAAEVSASRALGALDAAWSGLTGGESPGLVVDVYPAYLAVAGPAAGGGRPAFRPVWVADLDGGRRMVVDAVTGRVASGGAPARGEG